MINGVTFADDPSSAFFPPELALAPRPWTATTAEQAYLYSLGHTLLQGLQSTGEQVRVVQGAAVLH